tara:strand:- start:7 stop:531 length:525 start_codon:yes stop_codon:yes gene_type:complete
LISVIDNFINDQYLLDHFFRKYILQGHLQLAFTNVGNDLETSPHSFSSSMNDEDFLVPLVYDLYKKCNKLIPNPNMRIYRWHANVYPSGFDGTIHIDADYSTPTYLYCVSPWEPELGGEFIIYDENKEAKAVTSYKQDRLIIFDGKYPHRAVAPVRQSSVLRATIAFQTEILEK